jgi:adenylate kinase family enzyme
MINSEGVNAIVSIGVPGSGKSTYAARWVCQGFLALE